MADAYQMSDAEIATVVFRVLIYAIGVIGNLLVIFVILFLREYKKITHWYILQLAIADIIFLHNLPFKVTEDINGQWIHSLALCSSQQTVLFFTYYASILFLMIMAIDRYLAVFHPMSGKVRKLRTSRNAYIVSVIAWLVSLGLSVPAMLYSTTVGNDPYCKCTLQFPKDPSTWCARNGFSNKTVAPNKTVSNFDDCIMNIFPLVHVESCSVLSFGRSSNYGNVTNNSGFNFEFDLGGNTNSRAADGSGNVSTDAPTVNSFDFFGGFFPPLLPVPNNDTNNTGPIGGTSGNDVILKQGCFNPPDRPGWDIFMFFNFVAMFVIPFLVIVTCYSLIVRRLVTSSVSRGPAKSSSNGEGNIKRSKTTGRSEQEKTKATILCLLLAALFTICWLPFHSVHLAKYVGIRTDDAGFCQRLSTGTTLLAYLGSATNPYLYNFLGSFKKRIRQIKNSKSMQIIMSGTGNTALSGARPSAAGLSSEGPKIATSVAPPEEKIPLQPIE